MDESNIKQIIHEKIKSKRKIFGIFVITVSFLALFVFSYYYMFTVKTEVDFKFPEEKIEQAKQSKLYRVSDYFVSI